MPQDHDLEYDPSEDALWDALPEPEVLPYRTMLEEFETVNVLAPLVRCSKCEYSPRVASRVEQPSPSTCACAQRLVWAL